MVVDGSVHGCLRQNILVARSSLSHCDRKWGRGEWERKRTNLVQEIPKGTPTMTYTPKVSRTYQKLCHHLGPKPIIHEPLGGHFHQTHNLGFDDAEDTLNSLRTVWVVSAVVGCMSSCCPDPHPFSCSFWTALLMKRRRNYDSSRKQETEVKGPGDKWLDTAIKGWNIA